MIGEGGQDVWRSPAKFFRRGSRLQATAAGSLLQKKHLTFTEYETMDAKEQLATTELERCPVLVHLQSLGPDGGATPRTPFTATCPRLPAAEASTSLRPSTMRKTSDPQPYPSSPRVTIDAKQNGSLLLIFNGPNTDTETNSWRSLQSKGVQLQLPVLIHSGDSSLHSAQRREGAWKSLQITVPIENFNEKRQPPSPL